MEVRGTFRCLLNKGLFVQVERQAAPGRILEEAQNVQQMCATSNKGGCSDGCKIRQLIVQAQKELASKQTKN